MNVYDRNTKAKYVAHLKDIKPYVVCASCDDECRSEPMDG